MYLFTTCQLMAQKNAFKTKNNPEQIFLHPPESAKPGVLWMWMGSNVTRVGITNDLEALKQEGFNRATMYTPADILVPWVAQIKMSPTPEIVAWTKPWFNLVRYAAVEAKRLNIDFGIHNCAGYESSGGKWITPELSMQQLCWSKKEVNRTTDTLIFLEKPVVTPYSEIPFQEVVNTVTGKVEKPFIAARKEYYKDIAVLAMPIKEIVLKNEVIDVTNKMDSGGKLNWIPPLGHWVVYRFGHTTTGTKVSPAQPEAAGFECDKMNPIAVNYHMDYIINQIKKYLGDLIGNGFTHIHFDSYEAGTPTWTPDMPQEFFKRRGYDIIPYLPVLAGQIIDSKSDSIKLITDVDATIKDLYRDVYFKTVSEKLRAVGLKFLCEPYGGPWRREDVVPYVDKVMTEFWTNKGAFTPSELDATITAARESGKNIIEAEAFTGMPEESMWDETPAWLKPIGDAAFCAGVNSLVLSRFVHQPWDDTYKPGASYGQWGTHFDRTQTWWKPGKAMITYWQRCQGLLQWGSFVEKTSDDFIADTKDSINLQFIHRKNEGTEIYFVVNTSRKKGNATCTFNISDMQPELWNGVTGEIQMLNGFKNIGHKTKITIYFSEAQSFFIVFRSKPGKKSTINRPDFPESKTIKLLSGSWQVQFDKKWGGPEIPVLFQSLTDWTKNLNKAIKYFSGTATYIKYFALPSTETSLKKTVFYISVGVVKHIARVYINGKDLGVIWTAPWQIKIPPGILKNKNNQLKIEVTNVWSNRLIGDEQEFDDCKWLPGHMDDVIKEYNSGHYLKEFPKWFLKKQPRPSLGRFCFTTWNYFNKTSPLTSSGLLGPVQILTQQ